MNDKTVGKRKTILVFILTIITGYALFILPDLFFGVSKINGGKVGVNLIIIALFQFISICGLLAGSLKILNKKFSFVGLQMVHLKKDISLGLLLGGLWSVVQFLFIIPMTGGLNRPDIQGMLGMYDGSLIGILSFVALGVIGGGITEELFNRGYFINVLREVFISPKLGIWISSILSIVLFALGHMPSNSLEWFDILVPTIIYTLLFISTNRLTASIVAHGFYNMVAIVMVYLLYFN